MKKTAICMICERRYHELEEAEMCERQHSAPFNAPVARMLARAVVPATKVTEKSK